jgi:hypothetical protein
MVNAVGFSEWKSIRCACHTIQLAINDFVELSVVFQEMLSTCRRIVGHFSKSSKASQALIGIQKSYNFKVHKLIQEVK